MDYAYKKVRHIYILLFLPLLFSIQSLTLLAQTEAIRYDRKSISFLEVLLPTGLSIPERNIDVLISRIQQRIELPRFDYNEVPESIIEGFHRELRRSRVQTLEDIVYILDRMLVPVIIDIVDLHAEMRARELVTEKQRNLFISVKAKEYGITAEQLEQVMNSAYIYIPFITEYKAAHPIRRGRKSVYEVEISGGIVWYKIHYGDDKSTAEVVTSRYTETSGIATPGHDYRGYDSYRDYAFDKAAKDFAKELSLETKKIPDFTLVATVSETSFRSVGIPMGTKEGIRIDDKYSIIEKVEDDYGNIVHKDRGFIMISFVSDNIKSPESLSKGRIVINRGIQRGMLLEERPWSGVYTSTGFGLRNVLYFRDDEELYHFLDENAVYGVSISSSYNFGRNIGVSQLFSSFEFFFGFSKSADFAPASESTVTGESIGNGYVSLIDLNIGLDKRFFILGPLSIGAGIKLGAEARGFKMKEPREREFESSTGFYAAIGGIAQFTVSPMTHFGIKSYYRSMTNFPDEDTQTWLLYITLSPGKIIEGFSSFIDTATPD